jgi:hypothetical protein
VVLSGSRLIFLGITHQLFARLRKKATQNGLHVFQPTGEAVKDGVIIRWKYDPEVEMLEVACVHAPFWFNSRRIERKLSQEIESTIRPDRAA